MFPLCQWTPIHIHYHQQLYLKNTIAQYKWRGNSINNESARYQYIIQLYNVYKALQVHLETPSFIANFTSRPHLRVPTKFLAWVGQACPHTDCQPHSSTELCSPCIFVHDERLTWVTRSQNNQRRHPLVTRVHQPNVERSRPSYTHVVCLYLASALTWGLPALLRTMGDLAHAFAFQPSLVC